jgi:hypothetical protein
MIYKIFIDDSGKKEYVTPYSKDFLDKPPEFDQYPTFWWNDYFVLAGVRVKQEDIGKIDTEISSLKERYFYTHQIEVKSDWLRNPDQRKKHYLDLLKISPEKLNAFGEKFVDIIANHKKDLKIIAAVFDKRYYGNSKRQINEGNPLLKTTQILFERIQFAGNYNIVVFDQMESSLQIKSGQHGKILKVLQENEGLEKIYVEKYDAISDIKFAESSKENFLQIADICAYNIFRQFVQYGREWGGCKKDNLGKRKMTPYHYFDRIRCNFFYNPLNMQVRGYGLVCIPDINKLNWNLLKNCFNNKKSPQV